MWTRPTVCKERQSPLGGLLRTDVSVSSSFSFDDNIVWPLRSNVIQLFALLLFPPLLRVSTNLRLQRDVMSALEKAISRMQGIIEIWSTCQAMPLPIATFVFECLLSDLHL